MKISKKQGFIFIGIALLICAFIIYYALYYQAPIDFNTQVRPILNAKCTSCHGGVKKAGGISFIYREEALGMGKSGKVCIAPGSPNESEFIKRLTHHDKELRMPLGKAPLSDKEVQLLKDWVSQGAKWDKHWAFVPPTPVEVPKSGNKWATNFIDNFIVAQAEQDDIDLEPNPEADKVTLIRRVSLDITGLPPSKEEVQAFLKDNTENAYENLVNKLLQSPRYGEKWAGMWLDLARYADSKGYEKDKHRNIWRYRDYLIKSFNEDKKYTDFTIEQLAGDLLPNATEDQIIATAFHRNTLNNDEGGTSNEEFRNAAVIDRTNTTFDVWQGITMGCAQCHSHPYDPIRHKEYFQFYDYLNQTADCDHVDETPVFFSTKDFDLAQARKIAEELHKNGKSTFAVKQETAKEYRRVYSGWLKTVDADEFNNVYKDQKKIIPLSDGAYIAFKNVNIPKFSKVIAGYSMSEDLNGKVEVRLNQPKGKLIAEFNTQTTFGEIYFREGKVIEPIKGIHDVYFVFKGYKQGKISGEFAQFHFQPSEPSKSKYLDSLREQLVKLVDPEGTPVFIELPKEKRRLTRVFVRGSWQNLADTVEANVPEILNLTPNQTPKNRLEMAQWIASTRNPLTARVAVNRFWEQLFGTGIVETLEDFGSQGSKPSHPQLLDYLAIHFVKDCNWSMKKLIKTIVMSSTYKQSSQVSKKAQEIDPRNKYLLRGARFRLSTEQIRDQALAVSCLLSNKLYGPSVMPYQPEGIWQTVYNGNSWVTSTGEDRHRRALYTYIKRSSPYPSFLTFDNPSREFCVVRRIRTNTPLQSLVTLNDTVYNEATIALSLNVLKNNTATVEQLISNIYEQSLFKKPSAKTMAVLKKLYDKSYLHYQQHKNLLLGYENLNLKNMESTQLASLTNVASAIINLDEFLTKE